MSHTTPVTRFAAVVGQRRPAVIALSLGAVLALTLTACGPTSTQSSPAAPPASPGANARGGFGGRTPGVSGLIAARSGKTLQVQGVDGQTAVTYTGKTTFTELTATTARALKPGLCITVRSSAAGSSAAASPASGNGPISAASVILSDPVAQSCGAGFGGVGGSRGGRPSGAPTGAPSAGATAPGGNQGASRQRTFGAGVIGKVASGNGSSFVVAGTQMGSGTKGNTTVTSTSATTWTRLQQTNAKAVSVGKCVTAQGKTDQTGAMTATSLRLSASKNGTCSTGFGGRPGQNGPGTGLSGGGRSNG